MPAVLHSIAYTPVRRIVGKGGFRDCVVRGLLLSKRAKAERKAMAAADAEAKLLAEADAREKAEVQAAINRAVEEERDQSAIKLQALRRELEGRAAHPHDVKLAVLNDQYLKENTALKKRLQKYEPLRSMRLLPQRADLQTRAL